MNTTPEFSLSTYSESTRKQYIGRLNTIKNLFTTQFPNQPFNILNFQQLIPFITDTVLHIQTRKGYYSAVLAHLSETAGKNSEAYLKYHEEFVKLKKNCNEMAKQQELSQKQKDKYLTKSDLEDLFKKCWSDTPNVESKYNIGNDYLILLGLYAIQAPVRADYWDMPIVTHSEYINPNCSILFSANRNYCVLNTENPTQPSYFVFNKYKTDQYYGQQKINIHPVLESMILRRFKEGNNRVLPFINNSNQLSQKVRALFKNLTGKECSITLCRHAWVYDLYATNPTIQQKEDLARRMLHSRQIQEFYRTNEDNNCLIVDSEGEDAS